MITQQQLHELFDYFDGHLIYKIKCGKRLPGQIAGWNTTFGYRQVSINKKTYNLHRIVWIWHYGREPRYHLDHIDGNKSNNSIENLRECNPVENGQNRKRANKNNACGYIGVFWNKQRNKWTARISINRKSTYLGLYDTPEQAYKAYLDAKSQMHVFHPFVG